jgi:PleD family two-component response regulator
MGDKAAQFTLLIVEDDLDVAEMLATFFSAQGYRVLTAHWGEDGLRTCQEAQPDLVILDIRLPDIDGFEVARRLRAGRRTQNIPIVFLTEKRERRDKLHGLQLQADDYITKPFDIRELALRVRNALRRAHRASLTNPITGLPEGALVDESLERWLKEPAGSLWLVALKNLDAFREVYGFVAADDALRAVALLLERSLSEANVGEAFVGHLGSTDFVIIASPDPRGAFAEWLARRLEQSLQLFYRDADLNSERFRERPLQVNILAYNPTSPLPPSAAALRTALVALIHQGGV